MSDARKKDDDDDVDLKIEVVDDVPERDRGRALAPEATDNDDDIVIGDDEVSRYKEDIQKRIKDLSFKAHAERRTKEQAIREREEASRLAHQLYEENRRLRDLAGSNEKLMVDQAKQRAVGQIDAIKREAKEALEAGETERFLDAQEKLQRAVSEHERYLAYRPPAPEPDMRGHNGGPPMEDARQQVQKPPEPDEKGKAFMKRNPWFDADGEIEHEMTGYAFTMHDKLVRRMGIDPRSDEYYEEIEKAVRRRFPEYYKDESSQRSARDATTSAPTVVASASRSSRTARTVHLTPSMMKLAKRFGLTPEQYAAQYVKDYGNG
jgi:hypothetical protein